MLNVHLCFKDDRIYWDPGATEDEIYGQMSQIIIIPGAPLKFCPFAGGSGGGGVWT